MLPLIAERVYPSTLTTKHLDCVTCVQEQRDRNALKMDAICSSETSITIHICTQCNKLYDKKLYFHCNEILKYWCFSISVFPCVTAFIVCVKRNKCVLDNKICEERNEFLLFILCVGCERNNGMCVKWNPFRRSRWTIKRTLLWKL